MSTYVVRRVAGWMLLPMLAPAAVLGFCIVVDVSIPLLVFVAAITVVATISSLRDMTTRLRIDADGVTFSPSQGQGMKVPVFVPWLSVREVVVVTGPMAAPQVGVRLRPGAPLPKGVRGMIHDPAHLDAVQPSLTRVVPGLDRTALAEAVSAYGSRVVDATAL